MSDRLERLFSSISADCVLIVNSNRVDPNFWYFSGLTSGVFEGSALVVRPDGFVLVTGELEYETARAQLSERVVLAESRSDFWNKLSGLVSGVVGLNFGFVPVKVFRKLKKELGVDFVDVCDDLELVRMIKDDGEIELISKAGGIVSRVADMVPDLLSEGVSELGLKAELDRECTRLGSSRIPFSQVCFGENSAFPHHTSGEKRVSVGDFVLVDFGAVVNGYVSDLSRTFFYQRVSDEQERMYEAVLEAQERALNAIRPGVKASEVHGVAEGFIDEAGFEGRFIHSLGHMIGLEVHEGKPLSKREDFLLEEGMVFTVEPGIYIPGKGGVRIEDDIVVTKKGCKILTDASKQLTVIPVTDTH